MALERAAWLERRFGAAIDWLPFDLHPEYPAEGIPYEELRARYGDRMEQGVRAMIEEAGLPMAERTIVPNSRKSLVLAEHAREVGAHERIHPLLFRAYWADGRDIGDDEVLLDVAASAGVDVDDARAAIGALEHFDRIEASTQGAVEIGVTGVPAWLVDDRLLVPGAQPHDLFERVMVRLGHEPVPEPGS